MKGPHFCIHGWFLSWGRGGREEGERGSERSARFLFRLPFERAQVDGWRRDSTGNSDESTEQASLHACCVLFFRLAGTEEGKKPALSASTPSRKQPPPSRVCWVLVTARRGLVSDGRRAAGVGEGAEGGKGVFRQHHINFLTNNGSFPFFFFRSFFLSFCPSSGGRHVV